MNHLQSKVLAWKKKPGVTDADLHELTFEEMDAIANAPTELAPTDMQKRIRQKYKDLAVKKIGDKIKS